MLVVAHYGHLVADNASSYHRLLREGNVAHTLAHSPAGVKCSRNQMQLQLQSQMQAASAAAPDAATAPAAAAAPVAATVAVAL